MNTIASPTQPLPDAAVVPPTFSASNLERPHNSQQSETARSSAMLGKLEWIVGILLSGGLLFLLVVRATHAGGLWRDETAVVQLANMPSVADIMDNFQHEAFPPLFPLTIRSYTSLFGQTDLALRCFGFIVGALLVGALWINSRWLRSGPPLVGLSLLSLNTTFLVWGTTIRGYGLGCVFAVLIFGSIGALLQGWTRERSLRVLCLCLAGTQIILYNTVLAGAIGAAAAAIFLFRRQLKSAAGVLALCLLGVMGILPALPSYLEARHWNMLVREQQSAFYFWNHFELSLGNALYGIPEIWYAIAIGLTGLALWRFSRPNSTIPVGQWNLIWFALLVIAGAGISYYCFLRILSYPTNPWYYLALVTIFAAALDLLAANLCPEHSHRWARLILGGIALVGAPFADWPPITEQLTNVDAVARTVAVEAKPNDLIIVTPWQYGITFKRYYAGQAPWQTLPSLSDHQVHRYDLVKIKMVSKDPIADITQAVRATLMSGNRVWLAGGAYFPPDGRPPNVLAPAPLTPYGWDNRAYVISWWQQLSILVLTHADHASLVPVPNPGSRQTSVLEFAPLMVFRGWH